MRYSPHIQQLLRTHQLDIGSQLLLTLYDEHQIKGVLVAPASQAETTALQIQLAPGQIWGIPTDLIEQLKEVGHLTQTEAPQDRPERPLPQTQPRKQLALIQTSTLLSFPTKTPTNIGWDIFDLRQELDSSTPSSRWLRLGQWICTQWNQSSERPDAFVIYVPLEESCECAQQLAFLLAPQPVPIVCIPTPQRIEVPQQWHNAASLFAAHSDITEVTLCTPNHIDMKTYALHRGVAAYLKSATHPISVESLRQDPLALCRGETLTLTRTDPNFIQPPLPKTWQPSRPSLVDGVWKLSLTQDLPLSVLEGLLDTPTKGLVLRGRMDGMLPHTWRAFFEETALSFPILYTAQEGLDLDGHHDAFERLKGYGMLPVDGILPEVARLKLSSWLSSPPEKRKELRSAFAESWVGENNIFAGISLLAR
ncbi:MAG: hypothetical protein CL920_01650 [Deltaproteobacteria bacterium]|nr:hypothetical protein [Deltaproteobacteria bacterium]MBU47387.1 hypothetical protein [Deltaproteobacteria bacterium]|tara:strand:- start:4654 stop:5919 length:1266 start_codon:yes stop_codon:yes gene_type:complete